MPPDAGDPAFTGEAEARPEVPPSMRVVVFSSQKGGSGKTTLCGQLAVQADPSAWSGLATWFLYHPGREPTKEDLDVGLRYSAIAVDKARTSNTWRRNVLHDRCRIAVAAGRFDIVEQAMDEILAVWAEPCEPDIPMFEWDWMDKVPEGAIDAGLRARYDAAVEAVLARRAERERGGGVEDPPGPES